MGIPYVITTVAAVADAQRRMRHLITVLTDMNIQDVARALGGGQHQVGLGERPVCRCAILDPSSADDSAPVALQQPRERTRCHDACSNPRRDPAWN